MIIVMSDIFIFVLQNITLQKCLFIQISEDDHYIYCGTTSGDILQVSEIAIEYFSVNPLQSGGLPKGFLMFSGGIEKHHWAVMG